MQRGIKFLLVVMVSLAIASAVFLVTSKNKKAAAEKAKILEERKQAAAIKNKPATTESKIQSDAEKNSAARDQVVRTQWQQCKNNSLPAETKLFWNVKITEGIPQGGTYAKGNLDNDANFPVRITIKQDSESLQRIKEKFVPEKIAVLKFSCSGVAEDGSVKLEAF